MTILLALAVGKAFNKCSGFIVGLVLPGIVFYPLLAFGDSVYHSPTGGGFPVGPPQ